MTSNILVKSRDLTHVSNSWVCLGVSSKPADYHDETQSLPWTVFPSVSATEDEYDAYENQQPHIWGCESASEYLWDLDIRAKSVRFFLFFFFWVEMNGMAFVARSKGFSYLLGRMKTLNSDGRSSPIVYQFPRCTIIFTICFSFYRSSTLLSSKDVYLTFLFAML